MATPCWPAPVSAMTRGLPIRAASSAWPTALLILCAPVWARSSRLSQTDAPRPPRSASAAAGIGKTGRRAADEVAVQPAQLGAVAGVAARGVPRGLEAPRAPASASRARTARRIGRSGRGGRPDRPPAGSRRAFRTNAPMRRRVAADRRARARSRRRPAPGAPRARPRRRSPGRSPPARPTGTIRPSRRAMSIGALRARSAAVARGSRPRAAGASRRPRPTPRRVAGAARTDDRAWMTPISGRRARRHAPPASRWPVEAGQLDAA